MDDLILIKVIGLLMVLIIALQYFLYRYNCDE